MKLIKRTSQELATLSNYYWEMGAEEYMTFRDPHTLHRIDQILNVLQQEMTRRGFNFGEATHTGELS